MALEDDGLLRRLRVFLAVVDAGGVSEAALALQVSQPAVSMQIKRLERDLGIPLFRRSGRRLIVTDQGREIAEVLRRGLGELATTLNTVRDISRTRTAPLRFGFSAPQIALGAAENFRRTDPRTKLELMAANSEALVAALDAYALDIIMIGLATPMAGYHCQFYQRQSLTMMVPKDHPLAACSNLAVPNLRDEPIVLRETGSYTRQVFLEACNRANLSPKIAFEVATREAVAEAVRRGFGIGPVLHHEAPRGEDIACITIEHGRLVADDYLVCHAAALHYDPVRRFLAANRTAMPD